MIKFNIFFMLLDHFKYSLFIFPILFFLSIFFAKKLNFVDNPSTRKIHKTKTANISGLLIFGYLIFIVIANGFSNLIEQIIIVGFFVLVIGFIDDQIDLKPISKIILLFFPTLYLILNGFQLTNLGKYEYINTLKLGDFSIIFTFLAVLLLINAINYIDGSDGLLIGYSIITIIYFYFLSEKHHQYLQLFFFFIYSLLISLFFNFLPIKSGLKSFLGDAGSLFIGFFISFTMIYLYKYHNIHPAFLIWACWLPIYDFLYVTSYRLINKVNFSNPDKSHFHHHVLNYFLNNHFKTFLSISVFNIIIICAGYYVCLLIGKIYSIILFIIFFLLFIMIRLKLKKIINKDSNKLIKF